MNTMKHIFILFVLLASATVVQAQDVRMRDVFAQAPDSIFPLLTRNNRLDCIDFIENSMKARVKNRFYTYSELTALTADYLSLQVTEHSVVEMKLLARPSQQDTVLCMVCTYSAPAADSDIFFYDLHWNPLTLTAPRPAVDVFLDDDVDADARAFLHGLPLMSAALTADSPSLTWTLQSQELATELRKKNADKVHPIVMTWDGEKFR